MNIDSNSLTSPEPTIAEIIVDILEGKNRPEIEAGSDHEEEDPDKPVVIKKRL